ncbi:tetratricopeptide repeat protein [Cellulomonas sp. PhB143]|uniref:tetratricopeptide repeat protein n=1 Tax=Cellulomonas sp. PhB143 TaxID=2485186 RepID=UPI000F46BB2C|nr:tetratricopeptide repeat protein [Cellulomonas sp. PhB143]ROS78444.1 putative thioredoxin [Cellulomonas sp. PhB143]
MSDANPQSPFDVRGAVDLAALNRPQAPPPGQPGGAPDAGGYVVDVTDETFGALVESSSSYPVVVLLWIPTDQANAQVGVDLGVLAAEQEGRFLLARVDVEKYPQVAQAFQVQGVPTVVAVLAGQPVPLFQGGAPIEQAREVIGQVLAAAEANGVTGRAPSQGDQDGQETAAPAPEPEPELPPLHQEAYDAIERDDLDAAEAAYRKAIAQDPKDAMAPAGLAQVHLLQRTRGLELGAVRTAAADAPADAAVQLAVADMDMLGGKVEDAFGRLLDLLPGADAETKESVRARLVEYFEVVGVTDPRVAKARQRLAIALY